MSYKITSHFEAQYVYKAIRPEGELLNSRIFIIRTLRPRVSLQSTKVPVWDRFTVNEVQRDDTYKGNNEISDQRYFPL